MNIDPGLYDEMLHLAETTALHAGEYLRNDMERLAHTTTDVARDVKLEADRSSEKQIITALTKHSSFPILSEEIGYVPSSKESMFQWIVDPLDGSVNYLAGLPICCVSISLWKDENPLIGVVYDFLHENVYKGIVGVGAWLNETKITVNREKSLDQSILCTGFPVSMDFSQKSIESFVKQVGCFKKVRLFGSAAMSLAFVASGKADAYYEKRIKIWDVAAGLALVKAAGGVVDVQRYPDQGIVDAFAGTGLLLDFAR
jgi:myo-inositol-1(or 4)-monophosphatase